MVLVVTPFWFLKKHQKLCLWKRNIYWPVGIMVRNETFRMLCFSFLPGYVAFVVCKYLMTYTSHIAESICTNVILFSKTCHDPNSLIVCFLDKHVKIAIWILKQTFSGVAGWLSGAIFRSGTWVGLQIHPSGGRWTDNTPLTYRKSLEISVNTTKCVYLKTAFSVMMLGKCRAKMATFLCEVV